MLDRVSLNDLVEGENDWLNIQSVVRMTFKLVHETVLRQQEQIDTLKKQVKSLTDELIQIKDEQSEHRKSLNQKLELTEFTSFEAHMSALIEQKADIVEVVNSLKLKANAEEVAEALEQKVEVNRYIEDLELKANKASVAAALKKKASREELEQVKTAVDSKADRSEVNTLSNSLHSMIKLSNQTGSNVKNELDTLRKQIQETRTAFDTAHKLSSDEISSLRTYMSCKIDDTQRLIENRLTSEQCTSLIEDHFSEAVTREVLVPLQNVIQPLQASVQNKADISQQLDQAQEITKLSHRINEISQSLTTLTADMERKINGADVAVLLEKKADVRKVNQWIQQHTADVNSVLDLKSNLEDVIQLREDIKTRATHHDVSIEVAKSESDLSEAIQQLAHEVTEKDNRLIATIDGITDALQLKADTKAIEKELSQKVNWETVKRFVETHLENKVDRTDFNREITRIDSSKASKQDVVARSTEEALLTERLAQKASLQDLRMWAEDLHKELKRGMHNKIDIKELQVKLQPLVTQKAMEDYIERKLTVLRESTENLHRGVKQLLTNKNSSLIQG